jgi:mannose-6-phosphate isomerase class I
MHDWKVETFTPTNKHLRNIDPKAMARQELRSQLESEGLAHTISQVESTKQTSRAVKKEEEDLPTYFQSLQQMTVKDDKKVEIVTLELERLPRDLDEIEFKRQLFQKHHVIKLDT